jgi:hypothetical protein
VENTRARHEGKQIGQKRGNLHWVLTALQIGQKRPTIPHYITLHPHTKIPPWTLSIELLLRDMPPLIGFVMIAMIGFGIRPHDILGGLRMNDLKNLVTNINER